MTGQIEAILTYAILSTIVALYVSNRVSSLRNLLNEKLDQRGEDGKNSRS